jgi:hypothetical protein
MTEEQSQPTAEDEAKARVIWGKTWDLTREMIESVSVWNAATQEKVKDIVLPAWDELDDTTQRAYMYYITNSPAFDFVGGCMANALNYGAAHRAGRVTPEFN